MRKALFIIILVLALTQAAFAACQIDLDLISKLLAGGDFSAARTAINTLAGQSHCDCESLESPCFRLGPKGSETTTPKTILSMLVKLETWNREELEKCRSVNGYSHQARKEKLECFEIKLMELKSRSPYDNNYTFATLAKSVVDRYADPLREYFEGLAESESKVEKDSLRYRHAVQAEKIAKAICKLQKERKFLRERLDNVRRHKTTLDGDASIKITKIEYKIKQLTDKIEQLKGEFKTMTGKSFFPYEWCDK